MEILKNVDKLVDILVKYSIKAEDYFLLYLIYFRHTDQLDKYVKLTTGFDKRRIKYLERKGYIMLVEFDNYSVDNIVLNNTFADELFGDKRQKIRNMAREIWSAYPPYAIIQSKQVALHNMSFEDFVQMYQNTLEQYPYIHTELLTLIAYGSKNNMISQGIKKFFESEAFRFLKVQYKEDNISDNEYGTQIYN